MMQQVMHDAMAGRQLRKSPAGTTEIGQRAPEVEGRETHWVTDCTLKRQRRDEISWKATATVTAVASGSFAQTEEPATPARGRLRPGQVLQHKSA